MFDTANSSNVATTQVVINSSGNVGIGTTNPSSRLTDQGPDTSGSTAALTITNSTPTTEFQVFDNGNATLAGTLTQNSDERLKTNIQSLDASDTLSLIDQLNPVTFNWIDQSEGSGTQVGFIAQQVQQIFPNLVSTTSATALTPGGTLGLNYIGLIAPAVSAIQEIAAISGEFESNLVAWLGNAQNGITDLLAENGHFSNELCVGSTCVTPAQFQAMVQAANQSQSTAQQSPATTSTSTESVTQNSASTTPTTPPTITINGDNPAIITVGDSYADLGATVSDTGAGQAGDTNLGYQTFLNGTLVSNITIDTSQVATDTIDYVATDNDGLTATSTRTVLIEPTAAASSTAQ
jgi:hypothetical protein